MYHTANSGFFGATRQTWSDPEVLCFRHPGVNRIDGNTAAPNLASRGMML
jgi:hypothetical protein